MSEIVKLYDNGTSYIDFSTGGATFGNSYINMNAGGGVFTRYVYNTDAIDATDITQLDFVSVQGGTNRNVTVDMTEITGNVYIRAYYLTDTRHNEGRLQISTSSDFSSFLVNELLWTTTIPVGYWYIYEIYLTQEDPTPPTPPTPGFDITLYTTLSEKNRIVKELTEYATVHGTLKERTSVMTPIITLASGADVLAHVNYLYIPAFERYYFIEEVTSIRTDITEIRCRCDVLMTYADGILENEAVLKRQENTWNLYLDDGSLQVYNTPWMLTKLFPSGFTTQSLVLAVAGSAQGSNESS